MKRYLSASLVLTALGVLLWGAAVPALAAASKSACVACHEKATPAVVKEFTAGPMGRTLDCSVCHGAEHRSEQDVAKAKLPSPDTCAQCHPKKVEEFRAGKHALAWAAMKAMPMLPHQPLPVKGDGLKGCSGCHKIGDKAASEIARYGGGACDSCHTRHTFSVQEARDPRTCRTCHMGFDHPQWEMWQTSKHGTIWEIESSKQATRGSERAPTCQTCHLPGGNHGVMTAWGFLALRVPEDDPEWWKDRVTILQALGVLDAKGNPTERFAAVQGAKVARLSKEDFARERAKMLETCTQCHSRRYAEENLAAGDQMIREADRIFAQAIRTVRALYEEGLLQKPAGWTFAPDLLQFYEAKTPIEQDLYLIFMEYRMRTFQGAFHANPDYAHWYGWAKMKEAAVRIEDAAAALRAGQKR